MVKRTYFLILFILLLSLFCGLTACNDTNEQPEQFTVTVVGGIGGGVFKKDASCTVIAEVAQNREFVEWQIEGQRVSSSVSYTFIVTQNVVLTAVTTEKNIEPEPPMPELNLGFYARRWVGVNTDCGVLDLETKSWSIWDEFEVTSVDGDGRDAVVKCTVNGDIPYVLSITDDGLLKACDAEYPELNYTFMPSADRFNGLWALDDEDVIYALLIAELNDNNLFGWALVYEDGTVDEDYLITATTRLSFDTEGNCSVYFVNAYDVTYVIDANGNLQVIGEDLVYKPTSDLLAACYVDDSGVVYDIDVKGGVIAVNGKECRFDLQAGQFGAGVYFENNGKVYAIIKTLDGIYLYSGGAVTPLKPFALVGTYTNGKTTLTVSDDLTVTIGSEIYRDGVLTTLTDLDRVDSAAFCDYSGIQQVAIAFDNSSKYLIWIIDGVAVATGSNGNYSIRSAYYTSNALKALQDKFLSGLNSSTDFYTSGGVDRISLKLDFQQLTVILNGNTVPFSWHYVIKPTGDEYAAIAFASEIFNTECDCVLYPYFDFNYLRLETKPAGGSDKAVIHSLVSAALYEQMLNTDYYLARDGYVESVSISADGILTLVRGANGTVQIHSEYELTLEERSGTLVITFYEIQPGIKFEVLIYCDKIGISVSIVNDVYLSEPLFGAVGRYADDKGLVCFELLPDGRFKYGVSGIGNAFAQVFDRITIDGKVIVCVKGNITVTFGEGKVAVTQGNSQTVYSKINSQPEQNGNVPENFIGKYYDSDGVAYVEVLADNMFLYNIDIESEGLDGSVQPLTFDKITVDGEKVICTKTYSGGLVPLTVTFVFEGDSVTVTENNHAPSTYVKQ